MMILLLCLLSLRTQRIYTQRHPETMLTTKAFVHSTVDATSLAFAHEYDKFSIDMDKHLRATTTSNLDEDFISDSAATKTVVKCISLLEDHCTDHAIKKVTISGINGSKLSQLKVGVYCTKAVIEKPDSDYNVLPDSTFTDLGFMVIRDAHSVSVCSEKGVVLTGARNYPSGFWTFPVSEVNRFVSQYKAGYISPGIPNIDSMLFPNYESSEDDSDDDDESA